MRVEQSIWLLSWTLKVRCNIWHMSPDRSVLFIAFVLLPLDWLTYLPPHIVLVYVISLADFGLLYCNGTQITKYLRIILCGVVFYEGLWCWFWLLRGLFFLHISNLLAIFQMTGIASRLSSLARFGSLSSRFHSTLTTGVLCPLPGLHLYRLDQLAHPPGGTYNPLA